MLLLAIKLCGLTQLGKKIEKYYEMPMDIEWALEKDEIVYCSGSPHYCLTAGVGIAGKECSLHKGQFGRTPAKSSHAPVRHSWP